MSTASPSIRSTCNEEEGMPCRVKPDMRLADQLASVGRKSLRTFPMRVFMFTKI